MYLAADPHLKIGLFQGPPRKQRFKLKTLKEYIIQRFATFFHDFSTKQQTYKLVACRSAVFHRLKSKITVKVVKTLRCVVVFPASTG